MLAKRLLGPSGNGGAAPFWKNITKGYYTGGNTNSWVRTVDRFTYSSETSTSTGAYGDVNAGVAYHAMSGTLDKVIGAGGSISSTLRINAVWRTLHSTDVWTKLGTTLSNSRLGLCSCGNLEIAYYIAGYTGSFVNTVDKITFSTEVRSASTGYPTTLIYGASCGRDDKGIVNGGYSSNFVVLSTSYKLAYDTGVFSASSGANLPAPRYAHSACGNPDKGFYSGGSSTTSSGTQTNTIYQTVWSSETTSSSGSVLSAATDRHASTGTESYAYFAGGATPSAIVRTMNKVNFDNNTVTNLGNKLSQARYALGGA